ncbi:hypothetical protein PLESTM_001825400 [Pleodorina starrii]|nr:hypothetical protein PLESTM_001825400 [Pleodorina starrii]
MRVVVVVVVVSEAPAGVAAGPLAGGAEMQGCIRRDGFPSVLGLFHRVWVHCRRYCFIWVLPLEVGSIMLEEMAAEIHVESKEEQRGGRGQVCSREGRRQVAERRWLGGWGQGRF